MSGLKPVLPLRTVFSQETNSTILLGLLEVAIEKGQVALIFKDPHIAAAIYADGTARWGALDQAINNHASAPDEDTGNIVKDKMALVVEWMHPYCDKVTVIANDPANCSTRDEAKTNIGLAGLTAQKLDSSAKGVPEKATFTATIAADVITIEITNKDFDAGNIIIVAVEVPPVTDPPTPPVVVTLDKGQIVISSTVPVRSVTKTFSGKGKDLKLIGMNTKPAYNLYIYSMNGNKQISDLSEPVLVTILKT